MSIYPFSQSTHRFQGDATSTGTCAINSTSNLDYSVGSADVVSGGEVIVENMQFGDYITMNVVHPITFDVLQPYVKKHYINMAGDNKLDLRPLGAKVPTGLVIRTTYHAVNAGPTRNWAVNLYIFEEL